MKRLVSDNTVFLFVCFFISTDELRLRTSFGTKMQFSSVPTVTDEITVLDLRDEAI